MANKPAILLISGMDPQGCAGISSDIQTVQNHHAHPVPLLTGLTEQTQSGLSAMGALQAEQFMAQYQCCIADFAIKAIKIGLITDITIAHCIVDIIQQHPVPIVWDPVLTSSQHGATVSKEIQQYLLAELLPYVTVTTPNLPELSELTNLETNSHYAVNQASDYLLSLGAKSVLVKGGHAASEWAVDYFASYNTAFYSYTKKVNKSVRGTGCALASSLACHLAFDHDIRDGIILAKAYLQRGIRQCQQMGPYYTLYHGQTAPILQDMPRLCYQPEQIGQSYQFPKTPPQLGIYPVVDNADWVEKLVNEGIKTIQLRVKDLTTEQRQAEILKATKSSRDKQNIALFINDFWQDAITNKAFGVHLGQEDLDEANLKQIAQAGLCLGVSTHSYWELARALAINPSYIALGPIFETTSKQMPFAPQGIKRLQQWVSLLQDEYPVVAIGGINKQRAEKLKATGVSSVAMISAITKAENYQQVTRELIQCWTANV